MKEGSTPDWANFTVAKKATHGDVPDILSKQTRVKIRLTIELFTAPETGKH